MKFEKYLFIKDIKKHKWLLLLWFFLFVFYVSIFEGEVNFIFGGESDELDLAYSFGGLSTSIVLGLLNALQGLMAMLLISVIVHGDRLVGTSMFWCSRPISRLSLFFTKSVLLLSMFVLLPVVIEVMVLFKYTVSWNQLMLLFLEIFISKLAFVILFFFFASITKDLKQYLVSLIAVLLLRFLLPALGEESLWSYTADKIFEIFYPAVSTSYSQGLHSSYEITKILSIIILGSFIIAYQYIIRDVKRTLTLAFLGWFLFMTLTINWSWDFFSDSNKVVEGSRFEPVLKVALEGQDAQEEQKLGSETDEVRIKVLVEGLPANHFAKIFKIRKVRVEYPDGNIIKSRKLVFNKKKTKPEDELLEHLDIRALTDALDGLKPVNVCKEDYIIGNAFKLHSDDATKVAQSYEKQFGIYKGRTLLHLFEYRKVFEVSLAKAMRDGVFHHGIDVNHMHESDSGVRLCLDERRLDLLFENNGERGIRPGYFRNSRGGPRSIYILANRIAREAYLADGSGYLESRNIIFNLLSRGIRQNSLKTEKLELNFNNLFLEGESRQKIDQDWLSQAVLIRLDAVSAGSKRMDFEIEDFVLSL